MEVSLRAEAPPWQVYDALPAKLVAGCACVCRLNIYQCVTNGTSRIVQEAEPSAVFLANGCRPNGRRRASEGEGAQVEAKQILKGIISGPEYRHSSIFCISMYSRVHTSVAV